MFVVYSIYLVVVAVVVMYVYQNVITCIYLYFYRCVHLFYTHAMIVGNKLSGTVPTELAQLGSLGDLNLGKLQHSTIHIDTIQIL